jgi:hypothetical protein
VCVCELINLTVTKQISRELKGVLPRCNPLSNPNKKNAFGDRMIFGFLRDLTLSQNQPLES